jgi:membrane protease YdiL (CAAX protease family)
MLLTAIAGTVWSYTYLRDRALVPIAATHAVLGATYYCVFVGRDLIGEIARFLATP